MTPFGSNDDNREVQTKVPRRSLRASPPGKYNGTVPKLSHFTPPCHACRYPMLRGETECPRCKAERL